MKMQRRFDDASRATSGVRITVSARTETKKPAAMAVRASWWRLLPMLTLLCGVGSGCLDLKPVDDPTRYFLLSSLNATAQPSREPAHALSLGLAPVTVPDYLESPWMVVRVSDTEIRYSDFHKWGEPLNKGIQRVLAEDLGPLLDTDAVKLNAWRKGAVDTAIEVTINRFDVALEGQVVLDAQWQVTGDATKVSHKVIRRAGPSAQTDPAGAARTMSEALGDLSRAMAEELQR